MAKIIQNYLFYYNRYEQTVEECFHISKACIEPTLNNGKVCSVYLEQDNEEFILCNLSQKNLNESLDLNFTEGEKICFRVEVSEINSFHFFLLYSIFAKFSVHIFNDLRCITIIILLLLLGWWDSSSYGLSRTR